MPDLLSIILGLGKKTEEVKEIYIDDIIENPYQPREVFEEQSLQELAASIREFGVIQPIVVRRRGARYELVCGERRLRASKMIKAEKIPAIIRKLTDEESMEFCLIENLQRENLNPIEEAKVYLKLIRDLKLNQKQVAEKIGKSPLFISNMLKLLRLPAEVKENVSRETISKGHCFALLHLPEKSHQLRALQEIKEKHLSVKQSEDLVKKILLEISSGKKGKKIKKEIMRGEVSFQISLFQKIINGLKKKKNPYELTQTETDEYIEIKVIIPKKKKITEKKQDEGAQVYVPQPTETISNEAEQEECLLSNNQIENIEKQGTSEEVKEEII